jgi:hypothetical protein
MKRKRLLTAAAGALVAAAIAGIAWAAIPGPGNVYTACMFKGIGTIRLIDKSLPASNLMSRCTDKEIEIAWNQAGQPGPPGPQGATGEPGTPGVDGSDAASAFTGRVEGALIFDNVPPNGITRYAEPNGSSEHVALLDENTRTHLSPNATIVARDLAVKALMSGSGDTATFTLRDDGVDTAVSCTITVNAPSSLVVQTCDSGASTATILPGSELSLEITVNGTTLIKPPILFAWRATTP